MIFHFMPLIMCSCKTQGGIHPNVGLLARQDPDPVFWFCILVVSKEQMGFLFDDSEPLQKDHQIVQLSHLVPRPFWHAI